ncbi:MAG: iron-sulfur cluster assembly protein [Cellvibrionaceae bacterium]|jgi:iron-sulfur cluster assembly protein
MTLLVSDAARTYIGRQLENRGKGIGVRVGVKTAGCSGLSYVLEYVDDPSEDDVVFDQGNFNLVIDPKSLIYLDGTELGFAEEGLNKGLQFNNPNVKSECGCGESFHV